MNMHIFRWHESMQIIKITKANEREALQGKEGSKQDFLCAKCARSVFYLTALSGPLMAMMKIL